MQENTNQKNSENKHFSRSKTWRLKAQYQKKNFVTLFGKIFYLVISLKFFRIDMDISVCRFICHNIINLSRKQSSH